MGEPFDMPTAIVQGSLWICGYPIDHGWLRAHRIDLVVDVADPSLRLDPGALHGIEYRKQELVDGPELPAVDILESLVHQVVTAVRGGRKVLVACAGGRNRSGLVAGLAVCKLSGCSGTQALSLVQSRRQDALNNETFARHLGSLPARDAS